MCDDDRIEGFVEENTKEAIAAYIFARRCNACQLEQLMLFYICAQADLIKSHLDGCLRGAFGADQVPGIARHYSRHSEAGQQHVRVCAAGWGWRSTRRSPSFASSIAFQQLAGEFSSPGLAYRFGSYGDAQEMRRAINSLAFLNSWDWSSVNSQKEWLCKAGGTLKEQCKCWVRWEIWWSFCFSSIFAQFWFYVERWYISTPVPMMLWYLNKYCFQTLQRSSLQTLVFCTVVGYVAWSKYKMSEACNWARRCCLGLPLTFLLTCIGVVLIMYN